MKEPTQEELRDFVSREVYIGQSMLVEELLEKNIFDWGDITNGYYTEQEARDNGYTDEEIKTLDYQQPKEIFEWWVCSDWLIGRLEDKGEPILKTDFGNWWGRTCTGQAIFLDWVIAEIYKEMKQ